MGDEVVDLLRSIDTTLKAMLALAQQRTVRARASQPNAIASDRDLDGKYGNPELKFNPRDWMGAPFKGRRFSECPPELLDMIAGTFDWFAEQADQKNEQTNKGEPVSKYKRADAARARGWAKRIRDGKHVQKPAETSTSVAGWSDTGAESEWAAGEVDGF